MASFRSMGKESQDSDRTASVAEKCRTFPWRRVGIRKCARYPHGEDENAQGAWRAVAPDGRGELAVRGESERCDVSRETAQTQGSNSR